MTTITYEIPSFVPECEGMDMVNEVDPTQRIEAESCAWVRWCDVEDLILKIRAEYESQKPRRRR